MAETANDASDTADVAVDLATLGAQVEWTDAEAATAARGQVHPGHGRLDELAEWLAATLGSYPPAPPARIRCVVFGAPAAPARSLATALDVGLRIVDAPAGGSVDSALAAGAAAADEEVEAGADLLLVADPDDSPAAAVVVSVLTGAEPVALLPRGTRATDTHAWIAQAEYLRDTRRRIGELGGRPDELLARLAHPALARTAGFVLRAVARRTPVVLDGTAAVVAALLCNAAQARAGRWWRVADSSPDPVHAKAVAELVQRPVLDLAVSAGDGTAALLTVPVLRAATELSAIA